MPYEIKKGDCPEDKPFGVYKKDSSKKMGCHETHEKAAKQIAAISISEKGKKKDSA